MAKTKITKKIILESIWEIRLYIIFVCVTALIFKYTIDNYTYSVFKGLVQDFISSPDAIALLYAGTVLDLLLIFYYIIFFIAYRRLVHNAKAKNIWLEVTIFLIILSIIAGSFFLTGLMFHDLSSGLNDPISGKRIGELGCIDNTGHYLVGDIVTCNITQPILHNFSANISFTLNNGTTLTEYEKNNISFISPSNVNRVYFSIEGFDKFNNSISLDVGRDFEFYTESQYTESKTQFITYLAVIITIIFITIPSMMANFKKLCEK